MWDKPPPLSALQEAIADPSNSIGQRMRAAYYLRQCYSGNAPQFDDDDVVDGDHKLDNSLQSVNIQEIVIQTLSSGLLDIRHGSLMRHEFAYVLGQLRDDRCCDTLERILLDESDCVMVRHEAAEALGAIGSAQTMPSLQSVALESKTTPPELVDTCRLAIRMMEWRISQQERKNTGDLDGEVDATTPVYCACMTNPYSTVDPAPPHPSHATKTMGELGEILCDANQSIFDRYRAMFSLRNRGGADAVKELCRALVEDSSSALLRHEVAYVLGQLQHPASIGALEESLRRSEEHFMVRHESAEALGAIDGGRWAEIEAILTEFSNDPQVVVRESCLVALDAADYWGHSTADTQEELETLAQTEEHQVHTFAQQKAIVVDGGLASQQPKLWHHHFNVKEASK